MGNGTWILFLDWYFWVWISKSYDRDFDAPVCLFKFTLCLFRLVQIYLFGIYAFNNWKNPDIFVNDN